MRSTGVRELTFRIVLEDPPAGVDFGLQIGRGAEYETIQTQRSKGKDLWFEFSVGVGALPAARPRHHRTSRVRWCKARRASGLSTSTSERTQDNATHRGAVG